MSKVNNILSRRLNKKSTNKSQKMSALASETADGRMSSFSGIFSVKDLSSDEQKELEALLLRFSEDDQDISHDLTSLAAITSEVKAITNQAAILHGERIKRAQQLLTSYQEGAFSSWLLTTYGNRQTPYNFLLYYEFHQAMPKTLHSQIERMPRQAVYTLASRNGELDQKKQVVSDYNGETKNELLAHIRELFPLDENDKRRGNVGDSTIVTLTKLCGQLNRPGKRLTAKQKREIRELLELIGDLT